MARLTSRFLRFLRSLSLVNAKRRYAADKLRLLQGLNFTLQHLELLLIFIQLSLLSQQLTRLSAYNVQQLLGRVNQQFSPERYYPRYSGINSFRTILCHGWRYGAQGGCSINSEGFFYLITFA